MTDNLIYITVNNVEIKTGRKVNVNLSFQVYGRNYHDYPVVVVNHSLTGNSNIAGKNGWWSKLVGDEKLIDTNKFSVISFNIPGNGYGRENNDFIDDFVLGDIAKIFNLALNQLGITSVHALIGGSVGGGLVWEMGTLEPNYYDNLISIAANWKSSDWLIANTHLQNLILKNSKNPINDARIYAMLTYRNPISLNNKFRFKKDKISNKREVVNWLEFHGEKLKKRFSLESYIHMNRLLSTVDITHGNNLNFEKLIDSISSSIHLVGINSDILFSDFEIKKTYKKIREQKNNVHYYQIKSEHGHDAFLIEFKKLTELLSPIFKV